MLICPGAEETERPAIALGAGPHQALQFHLADGLRDAIKRVDAQAVRYLVEQLLDVVDADGVEHRPDVGVVVRYERHLSVSPPGIANGRPGRYSSRSAS